MTSIKKVIEIALNAGYTVPRYKVKDVVIGRTIITVYYTDNLALDTEAITTVQFAI